MTDSQAYDLLREFLAAQPAADQRAWLSFYRDIALHGSYRNQGAYKRVCRTLAPKLH